MLEKDLANIQECLYAIDKIKGYVKDISSADELFEQQETYDATLLNFIVIAEACNRLSAKIIKNNKHINWKGIKGFRNFIAHDYFGVDASEVWSVIKFHLPELKTQLKAML